MTLPTDRPTLSDEELDGVGGGITGAAGIVGTVFLGAVDESIAASTRADNYAGNLPSSASDGASGGDDPNDSLDSDGNYTPGWNASTD